MENKKRFVVKQYLDPLSGNQKRDLFINDELFEYEVDLNSLQKAREMGPLFYLAAQRDIQKHFIDSLSDFMGRTVTTQEVHEAIKTGWI